MSTKIFHIIVCWLIGAPAALAIEVSLGNGNSVVEAGISPFVSADIALDTRTLTLSQPHKPIGATDLFMSARLDWYSSDFLNRMTDFASQPAEADLPFIEQSVDDLIDQLTPVPVPADYRIHGINLDFSLGYDVLKTSRGFVGIGINTGLSLPVMNSRNLQRDANVALDLLDTTQTEIRTWKIGPVIHTGYQINPSVLLHGMFTWNYQTGEIDNTALGSGIRINGQYTSADINARVQLQSLFGNRRWLKHWQALAGYRFDLWGYTDTDVTVRGSRFSVARPLSVDVTQTHWYLGLSYQR